MAIENEGKTPSFDVLAKLIHELELPPDAIFYPDGKPGDSEIEHIDRLLERCSRRDMKVVTALVESIVANP
jgi:hypothetical protein